MRSYEIHIIQRKLDNGVEFWMLHSRIAYPSIEHATKDLGDMEKTWEAEGRTSDEIYGIIVGAD